MFCRWMTQTFDEGNHQLCDPMLRLLIEYGAVRNESTVYWILPSRSSYTDTETCICLSLPSRTPTSPNYCHIIVRCSTKWPAPKMSVPKLPLSSCIFTDHFDGKKETRTTIKPCNFWDSNAWRGKRTLLKASNFNISCLNGDTAVSQVELSLERGWDVPWSGKQSMATRNRQLLQSEESEAHATRDNTDNPVVTASFVQKLHSFFLTIQGRINPF